MRITALLLAAALAGAGTAANAEPADYGHHHGDELFRGIGLSDVQKTQVRQIEQSGWAQARPVMQQMHAVHEQIASRLLAPGSVSEADVAPLMQQEQTLRSQLDTIHLAYILQARSVLTPGQLAQAATKHQQMEALHEQEHQLMQPASAE